MAIALLALAAAGTPAQAAGRPDLLVTKLSHPAGNARPGITYTARAAIRNLGTGSAGRSSAGFYLSTDARPGRDDIRLGGVAVGSLAPGRGALASKRFTISGHPTRQNQRTG